MLGSVTGLKTYLRISDTSQDTHLESVLRAADAVAKRWCKRTFEQQVLTEHYTGDNTPHVVIRQTPVVAPRLSATVVSGNTTVTIASGTTHLLAGMPAVNANYLGYNTTISSVTNTTSVVLSSAPNTTGTITVSFGLSVWLDNRGFFGTGDGAFPENALLTEGTDCVLSRDEPAEQGWSRSGKLIRLGGGPTGSVDDWPWQWRKGTLTARMAPAWPAGYGNIRVTSSQGYPAGAVPDDLVQAVYQLAAAMRVQAPVGVPLDVTAITEQWLGLLSRTVPGEAPELTAARVILRSYRQAAF